MAAKRHRDMAELIGIDEGCLRFEMAQALGAG
jgi:hypothetical protein